MTSFLIFVLSISLIIGTIGIFVDLPTVKITSRNQGKILAAVSYLSLLLLASDGTKYGLLVLLFVATFLTGLAGLIYPIKRIGIQDRKIAAMIFLFSFLPVMLTALAFEKHGDSQILYYKITQMREATQKAEQERRERVAYEEKLKTENPDAYAKLLADKDAEMTKQTEAARRAADAEKKAIDDRAAMLSGFSVLLLLGVFVWIGWLGSAIKVEILAGDFKTGFVSIYSIPFKGKRITLKSPDGKGKVLQRWKVEQIYLSELDSVDEVTKENEKKFAGALGAGLVGGAIFGGAGLLAGALAGGRKSKVAFAAKFKDGRKFLATVDGKNFLMLKAAAFK